ncbi:hypothetical protein CYLTODRAFT_418242 [Cylindrobasidium torrendii FP15055 ss-10]|uniref:GmrSD restriction endonucleases N-terminal domain-containing protein n=1 Tax=Cylindrobasidium torrendii FP15055 ss-10 TaxID=1314674 RepID=A0A0D7BNB8_9AGAR|nr:hypothetical protein CYLTODRAFT_418242 [Cylindrobasidium torrendii FP15055 ss-10]
MAKRTREEADPAYEEDELMGDPEDEEEAEEFEIQGALKAPRATTYSASSLFNLISQEQIILDPEYQRDIVWTSAKQSNLIDSIMRNYYIPPIVFATGDDEKKTCIDGKQRLTSINLFMEGNLPFIDSVSKKRLWFRSSDPKNEILPKKLKRQFENRQIVCVEYTDLTVDNEHDIFSRVQNGVALNQSEKLQAILGNRNTFIRTLSQSDDVQGLPFEKKRGADFRVIAHAACTVMSWSPSAGARQGQACTNSHAILGKWLAEAGNPEVPSAERKRFRGAVRFIASLNPQPMPQKRTIAPMELVGMIIFAYYFMQTSEADPASAEAAQAVARFRSALHSKVTEIKMNYACAMPMLQYIVDNVSPEEDAEKAQTTRTRRGVKKQKV